MLVLGSLIIGGVGVLVAELRANNALAKKQQALTAEGHAPLLERGDLAEIKAQPTGDENFPVASASLAFVVAGHVLFAPLMMFGVGGLVYLVWPTWKQAYRDITEKRRFTRMVLESFVLPGAIFTGYFLPTAIAYWFLYLALHTVAKTKGNTTQNLANIFAAPAHRLVYVDKGGVEVELMLQALQPGDILVLGAGEIIPVDGTIVDGHAAIDQHMLTGESQLVEKQLGDAVLAATIVLAGHIKVAVEKTGKETLASQTGQILEQMISFTESLELRSIDTADRLALPYFMFGSAVGFFRGAGSGLAVFWSPLDDALYSVAPLGVLNYLNIALRRGILVKDGRALETLRHVDTIVFDKTGTLTTEVPHVVQVHICDQFSETEVLRYAAAAEQKQLHPVALAILAAASAQALELPQVKGAAYKTGYGLTVTVNEQTIRVGSYRFMAQQLLPFPEALQAAQQASHDSGYSLVYVAVNDAIVGAIELHASVRPDTVKTINKLHELGYQVCIISGDHDKPTKHLAAQLGIDRYFAETLPEDKAHLLKAMQQEGRSVCYLGDGINDTIALKQADVAVSLLGASTIATDTAQVVLMNEQLYQLVELLELAEGLDSTYKKTVLSSAIPTVGIVGGALVFHLGVSAAVLAYMTGMGLSAGFAMLPLAQEWRISRQDEALGKTVERPERMIQESQKSKQT